MSLDGHLKVEKTLSLNYNIQKVMLFAISIISSTIGFFLEVCVTNFGESLLGRDSGGVPVIGGGSIFEKQDHHPYAMQVWHEMQLIDDFSQAVRQQPHRRCEACLQATHYCGHGYCSNIVDTSSPRSTSTK
jgi:hypothetical protein